MSRIRWTTAAVPCLNATRPTWASICARTSDGRSLVSHFGVLLFVLGSASPAQAQSHLDSMDIIYVGSGLKNWKAQQGIAYNSGRFFTTYGDCADVFPSSPARLFEWVPAFDPWEQDDFVKLQSGRYPCHLGDVDADEDYVYGILTNGPSDRDREDLVMRFDRSMLTPEVFLDATALHDKYGYEDLSGVALREGRLYISTYHTDPRDTPHVLVYDIDTKDFYAAYEISTHHANGLAFVGDWMYVSWGPADDGETGNIHIYRIEDLQAGESSPYDSYTYDIESTISFAHAEGLTFRGGQLWTAQWEYAVRHEPPAFPSGLWLEQDKLTQAIGDFDNYKDHMGRSVSISDQTGVAGVHNDDSAGNDAGAALVFREIDGEWRQIAKLTADDAGVNDVFGWSVSISGDTIAIGAKFNGPEQSGAAYVFRETDNDWQQIAKLTADDGTDGDQFGASVSISGDTMVIGAPFDDDLGGNSGSAYVFRETRGRREQIAKLTADDGDSADWFGESVAISGDRAIVGAHRDEDLGKNVGSAYIFDGAGGSWQQVAKLLPSDGEPGDLFGGSIEISGDTAVVGATGDDDVGSTSGSVYVFRESNGRWIEAGKLNAGDGSGGRGDQFGSSVSISNETIAVGARGADDLGWNSGSAYVFRDMGGRWEQIADLDATDGLGGDYFGNSVSIDGDRVLVGAPFDGLYVVDTGSAYVFEFTGFDCFADFNDDGSVTVLDFIAFHQAWQAQDRSADCDGNGIIDVLDFVCFQQAFQVGCG